MRRGGRRDEERKGEGRVRRGGGGKGEEKGRREGRVRRGA